MTPAKKRVTSWRTRTSHGVTIAFGGYSVALHVRSLCSDHTGHSAFLEPQPGLTLGILPSASVMSSMIGRPVS
jgi:hypothetical protein